MVASKAFKEKYGFDKWDLVTDMETCSSGMMPTDLRNKLYFHSHDEIELRNESLEATAKSVYKKMPLICKHGELPDKLFKLQYERMQGRCGNTGKTLYLRKAYFR